MLKYSIFRKVTAVGLMERHAGNNVVKSSAMNHFLLLFSLLVLLASVSVTNSAGKCSWDVS